MDDAPSPGPAKLRKPFAKRGKWKGKGLDLGPDAEATNETHSGQQTPEGPHIEVTSHQEDHESMDDSDHDRPTTSSRHSHDQPRRSSSSSHIYTSYITSSPPQSPTTPGTAVPDMHLTPVPQTAHPPPSAAPTITKATFSHMSGGSNLQTESRGCTDWSKLHNYNVKWDHRVSVVVQMDVHRETGDLLPNELKLVVMQVSTLLLYWP